MGPLPQSGFVSYLAVAGVIAGWSLRRLRGESLLRSVSLGAAVGLPLLFLSGDTILAGTVASIKSLMDRVTFWATSIYADLFSVPFAWSDQGLQFASGLYSSSAAFDNVAGILVAMAISMACSILARHALIPTLLGLVAAMMWWLALRAWQGVGIAQANELEGPFRDLALPLLSQLGLIFLVVATTLGIGFTVGRHSDRPRSI